MESRNHDDREEHQRLLPMTPSVFYVMLALSEGEKHGYAIMQQVESLADGKFRMGPGTLYTTLQRLLGLHLIEEIQGDAEADSRRRCYRITRAGKELLREEIRRMESAMRFLRRNRLVSDAK
jgi:DNA-binding PadR family transcriptional regulator